MLLPSKAPFVYFLLQIEVSKKNTAISNCGIELNMPFRIRFSENGINHLMIRTSGKVSEMFGIKSNHWFDLNEGIQVHLMLNRYEYLCEVGNFLSLHHHMAHV